MSVIASAKEAAHAELSYSLGGRLVVSQSGWCLLEIPNAFVLGLFKCLHEPEAELPVHDGRFNAHISVMTAAEVARLGGPAAIKERGQSFRWTPGPLRSVNPPRWDEVSRAWFVEVKSPDLKRLRVSYGLATLPYGDQPFHVTVAIKRTRQAKAAAWLNPAAFRAWER